MHVLVSYPYIVLWKYTLLNHIAVLVSIDLKYKRGERDNFVAAIPAMMSCD